MKIALVSSHGGHLTQILKIIKAFTGQKIFFVTYFSSRDDYLRSIAPAYFIPNTGRRFFLRVWSVFWSLIILLRERPQVVFSTGAELALPFFFWAKILRMRTFYLETWSAVNALTNTGKYVYRLADEFWVQWPELLAVCGPKAKYMGGII
jgi:beta-1,4-N-acetylglucosaminyltransferase